MPLPSIVRTAFLLATTVILSATTQAQEFEPSPIPEQEDNPMPYCDDSNNMSCVLCAPPPPPKPPIGFS